MITATLVGGLAVLTLVGATGRSRVVAHAAQERPDGDAVFRRECSACHVASGDSRAPAPDVLRMRSPEAILQALTAGSMRPQGGRLTGAERRAVAEFVTGRTLGGDVSGASVGRCVAPAALAVTAENTLWTGWSPTSSNNRAQSSAKAGLAAADVPRLALKWALGFPDATSAWSQPTVAGGRLFVGSQNGTVYALDATSGCIIWTFSAKSGVRTAPVFAARSGGPGHTLYFGDTGANVYAVDADTGRQLWIRRMDEHLYARVTGTPTLDGDRLYVPVSSLEETAAARPGYPCCSFRGSVAALNAASGAVIWQTYLVPPARHVGTGADGVPLWAPSGVGVWSSPTVDRARGLVYITTGNTYSGTAAEPTTDSIIALDPETGTRKWSRQLTPGDVFGCRAGGPNCLEQVGPDFDFGTPAVVARTRGGRDLILLGQKSGMAYAIDPDRQGEVVWEYRAGKGSIWGGIQWGIAADEDAVFLPVSDIRTETPGGLHAVSLARGERLWYHPPPPVKCQPGRNCSAALISAPTLIPGVLFSGSNDGAIRAHAVGDGSVVWEFDTNREFETLNGVKATGGSIQGPGPTVAGGMVYVNAGYGDHLGRPGNVLLAFGVK